jgi:hypothetical protein
MGSIWDNMFNRDFDVDDDESRYYGGYSSISRSYNGFFATDFGFGGTPEASPESQDPLDRITNTAENILANREAQRKQRELWQRELEEAEFVATLVDIRELPEVSHA